MMHHVVMMVVVVMMMVVVVTHAGVGRSDDCQRQECCENIGQ
jgi:hypothetical protein